MENTIQQTRLEAILGARSSLNSEARGLFDSLFVRGESREDVSHTTGFSLEEIDHRVDQLLYQLRHSVSSGAGGMSNARGVV